jgi:hypothetical protein
MIFDKELGIVQKKSDIFVRLCCFMRNFLRDVADCLSPGSVSAENIDDFQTAL